MTDADAAIAAFNAHIDRLEEEHGVELSDEERQHICGLSVAGGFSPESTEHAFGDLAGKAVTQNADRAA
jgi:hypothetical protein